MKLGDSLHKNSSIFERNAHYMNLPPPKRILLFPLEKLYTAITTWRRRWYERHPEKRYKAPVRIVSVGNLSMGGTGKTPMAIWLMEYYLSKGLRPAYLSRGYGRKTSGYLLVEQQQIATSVGDEALMVARRFPDLPVAVCESRSEGIKRLVADIQPDIIILDDAFQHLKVHRDLDLVLMDATRMPDEDYPLPGGRLRESLFVLSKADALIVNRVESEQHWNQLKVRLAPWNKPVAGTMTRATGLMNLDGTIKPLPGLAGKSAILFSGLGNNASFRLLVTLLGVNVIHHQPFRDHHRYSSSDLSKINQLIEEHPEALLLTSEKDLTRLIGIEIPSPLSDKLEAIVIGLEWMAQIPDDLLAI